MLVAEGVYGSIGGEDGKWTLSLNRRGLLPYRDVFTVEDYLALRDPHPEQPESKPPEVPDPPAITITRRSPVTGSTAERHWRGLYAEFSELLERYFSRQQAADLFYEYGVTETPAAPPEAETVRDFAIEQLQHGHSIPTFLRSGLPKVILDLDLEGANVASICRRLETLGYSQEEIAKEKGVASYLPPKRLPRTPVPPRLERGSVHARVPTGDLPNDLKELVEELNDNLRRDNRYAAALLTRKIIGQAVYVAMARRGLQGELKKPDGDDLDLAAALVRCKEACGIPTQVMARVTTAKWIGDTANHSYRAKVSPEELERTVTGVSLFLKEVL